MTAETREKLKKAIGRFLFEEGLTYEELCDVISEIKDLLSSTEFSSDFMESNGISTMDWISYENAFNEFFEHRHHKKISRHFIGKIFEFSKRLEKLYDIL